MSDVVNPILYAAVHEPLPSPQLSRVASPLNAKLPDRLCALLYFGAVGVRYVTLVHSPIVAEPAPIFIFAPFVPPSKLSYTCMVGPVAPKLKPVIVIDEPSIKLPEKPVISGWAKADALQKMTSRNEIAVILIKLFFLMFMTNTPSLVAIMFSFPISHPSPLPSPTRGEGIRNGLLKQKKPPKGLFPDFISGTSFWRPDSLGKQ